MAANTVEKVWHQCQSLDQMSNSWTSEDPKSIQAVIAWLDSQPDLDGRRAFTDDKIWEQCQSMDELPTSWTDEDPKAVADVMNWLKSQPDSDAK
jgi:hypothetical protein